MMMKNPRLFISDTHYHNWSAFSGINENHENTRLRVILESTAFATKHLHSVGGRVLYHGGDVFHVRGSVAPTVFNPVVDLYQGLSNLGFVSHILAGNHDLESKDSRRLSNAGRALGSVATVYDDPEAFVVTNDGVLMVPWYHEPKALLEALKRFAVGRPDLHKIDALIHAPVNGVIKGIPDHGIEAGELADIGFRRVFVGHYHDHKIMEGGKVISIGALTHQTWGDAGSKAGYLIVTDDEVYHYDTEAPRFVDLGKADLGKLASEVTGNYVRLEIEIEKDSKIEEVKNELRAMGAAGVVINPIRKKVSSAPKLAAASLATMEGSISSYIDARMGGEEDLKKLCLEILAETSEI